MSPSIVMQLKDCSTLAEKSFWSAPLLNGRIGRNDAKHRRHVWIDHACPLGRSPNPNLRPGNAHLDRDLFGESIGCHDSAGKSGALIRLQTADQLWNRSLDAFDWQRYADSPSRTDQHLTFLPSSLSSHRVRHSLCMLDTS